MDRLETQMTFIINKNTANLHSSMDRLETDEGKVGVTELDKFTFQYG